MNYKFTTELTPSECFENIKLNATESSFINMLSGLIDDNKDFYFKINKNKFRIDKIIRYKNSFKPYFYGEIIKTKHGSHIEGKFQMHPFTRSFMVVWFAGLFYFAGIVLNKFIRDYKDLNSNELIGISSTALVLALFAVFGIGIVKLGQRAGRKDEESIVYFIEKTCKAMLIREMN